MSSVDIRFIASCAGVSPATVSRVLNGTKLVSPALREKVLHEVEKYGYRPNMMARGLIIRRSNLIGVITPNVSGYFHAKVIGSVEEVAAKHGYNVIVSNVSTDFAREKESFRIFAERRVDGIILMHENSPQELQELMQIAEVPIVMASANAPNYPLPTVGIDDRLAAYDAAAFLLRLGHRKIGAILNDCYSLNTLRREGLSEAMHEFNTQLDERWVRIGECRIADGERLASQIFSGSEIPTALFCVSDEQAVGAINYLLEHGFHVPNDISIVGFDDVELSMVSRPKLTTVRQPISDIGRAAAQNLLDRLAGKAPPDREILPHMLVVRGSTAEYRERSSQSRASSRP